VIVQRLPIEGALSIELKRFSDARGTFEEAFSLSRYAAAGVTERFVQDNLSRSKRDVLRGLHADPRMAKLVQVLAGAGFDVIVDIRPDSLSRGKHFGTLLAASEARQLYIPAGCLHGFLALEDDTILSYKQTAEYDPGMEFGVAWDDPELAIDWPLDGRVPILSPKDAANPTLRERRL
jgi:dTDP-4-dehydrorhamnose 3,5-epimerase